MAKPDVHALLHPHNVVIVGASDRPGSWSKTVFENLGRFDYPHPVYAVNPRYPSLWGQVCYPSLDALPEAPDHLVVVVNAKLVAATLEEGARLGARSATVFSSGFGEDNTAAGREMGAQLREVIEQSSLTVSGPNCLGNICARSRLITMTDRRIARLDPGPVAVFGQSGGVVMALHRTLADRGMDVGSLVASGNELTTTGADYIEYFVDDPDVRVILAFIEAVPDAPRFLAACRQAAAARKPVVAIKMGGSEAGRAAALAHTGSLAGSLSAFDAVTRDAGLIRVDNLDEMVELAEYFVHAPIPKGPGAAAITFSGGLKGLVVEAAHRRRLAFAPLSTATEERLSAALGVGTSLGNPLDSGFTGLSDNDAYIGLVQTLLDDPGVDLLMAQEELMREAGNVSKERNLANLESLAAQPGSKPIVMFSMISHNVTDYGRTLRGQFPHLPFLQEVDRAAGTVQRVLAYAGSPATSALPASPRPAGDPAWQDLLPGPGAPSSWNEVASRELLSRYGIPCVPAQLASDEEEAVAAAERLGYPVVLKIVSADVAHKSDIGGVVLNLTGADDVRRAFRHIIQRVRVTSAKASVDGVLVSPFLGGAMEWAIGVHRDPEMGPVVMAGAGGVDLEVHADVAFGPPGLSRKQAEALIDATRAGRLLSQTRGRLPRDREALIDVVLRVGQIAKDMDAVLTGLDINPLMVLEHGEGCLAVDALAVTRPANTCPLSK